jgi:hypothetical protein
VSSRARQPNDDGDSIYPIDVGAEIEREATVKAVRKRLRKRMTVGESPPAKPKLVWTAEELAPITGINGGPADRDRANPLDLGTSNPATPVGLRQRPMTLRDDLEVDPSSPVNTHPHDGRAGRHRKRDLGRPRGTRYLTRTMVIRASGDLDADAAAGRLRTRDGRVRRYVTMEDLAEKLEVPLGTLRDFLRADHLNWRQRALWPSE